MPIITVSVNCSFQVEFLFQDLYIRFCSDRANESVRLYKQERRTTLKMFYKERMKISTSWGFT